ncbi:MULTISPECIES: alpha/beta hydrolase [unclassified Marinobacterium]|uniref:alpha/beta hydrolase n=1 Tax=unclassified Marinobacterium TaxID=2644139 RepID=UPI00156844F7|nr:MULTISPECIES: alpha/beta hydrolase [unclassified Marinobacterium]NRP47879.1 Alpha/beta hydrolase family protein [Marinobacterium sp. xm-d-543]NRQ24118.1 Alpha/beta hydrolase family protein [Marinobacterium sp. xm-m-312]
MKLFKRTAVLLTLTYLSACGYMYFAQDSLIFKPTYETESVETIFPGASELFINTPHGNRLQTWYKPAKPGQETLVYLHGNARNLSTRGRLINILSENERGLLIFSWSGFGQSRGTPSEVSFYDDARAVFDWLAKEHNLNSSDLIIYGESLGTGVAVQLATERDFKGVILAAPYTSIAQMAADDYPWLPVNLLLKHRFDSIDKIQNVDEPVVIMHSADDDTIPYEQGVTLFEAAEEPKLFMGFEDREHTRFRSEDVDRAIRWVLERE